MSSSVSSRCLILNEGIGLLETIDNAELLTSYLRLRILANVALLRLALSLSNRYPTHRSVGDYIGYIDVKIGQSTVDPFQSFSHALCYRFHPSLGLTSTPE